MSTIKNFAGDIPTDGELDAMELSIDDQMYCSDDVIILITEIRRLRSTSRSVFKLIGRFAEQIDPLGAQKS